MKNKYVYKTSAVVLLGLGAFVVSVITNKGEPITDEVLKIGTGIVAQAMTGTNQEKFSKQNKTKEAWIMLSGLSDTGIVNSGFLDFECNGEPRTWADYAWLKEYKDGTLVEVAHKDCGKNSRAEHTTDKEMKIREEYFGAENIMMKKEGRKIINDLSPIG